MSKATMSNETLLINIHFGFNYIYCDRFCAVDDVKSSKHAAAHKCYNKHDHF